MYCKNCGQKQRNDATYCTECGEPLEPKYYGGAQPSAEGRYTAPDDSSSVAMGILGFLIPLVGLILGLVYYDERPKRAKSAFKGTCIRVVVNFVVGIIFSVLTLTGSLMIMKNIPEVINKLESQVSSSYGSEDGGGTEGILAKYADVSFGNFEVTDGGYGIKNTCLDVTVKNKSSETKTYTVTIEAVDSSGARLETDMVIAYSLTAGQEVKLKAFEYVESDKIDELKNAQFKVLEIQMV